jgi:hypothetical protein
MAVAEEEDPATKEEGPAVATSVAEEDGSGAASSAQWRSSS